MSGRDRRNVASKVSIIMYHYVRDLEHSRYPEIKGLPLELFKEQLYYILKYYKLITMEELISAVKTGRELPRNSALLTFDDAYRDHYDFVFPILNKMGVQGSFFPPVKAIVEHQVLDVNKIHFILASVADKRQIVSDIFSLLDGVRKEYSLKSNKQYYDALAKADGLDTEEVLFIKRILQRDLPEKLRNQIVASLFSKYVSEDEAAFSSELYMDSVQLAEMKKKGMHIGVHSYDHYWLDTLPQDEQKREIRLSLEFLKKLGCPDRDWVMCYPYGAYDDALLVLLKESGCVLGLTTRVGIADLADCHPLTLPRLDTNDLPKDKNAAPNFWTQKVIDL